MGLIGNYSILNKHPGRDVGGGAIGLGMNRGEWNKPSMMRGQFVTVGHDKLSGVPDGYALGYAWAIPIKAGGMRTSKNLAGSGALTGALTLGKDLSATLIGSGSLTASCALVVSLVAALSGSGTITNAALLGRLNLAAALAGSGNLTGAMTALANCAASLSGAGAVNASLRGTSSLSAEIVVTGDLLNSANVADAVWGAIATSQNVAGTMGEKLNDAGSAGNPWATVIEAGMPAEEILRVLLAYVAGKTTVDESGASPVVAFRDQADTKDRISAIMDGSLRSDVTLDGS